MSVIKADREVVIDVQQLLTPLALIISAIIISVPISLSIYFGLTNAGLSGKAGTVSALECDSTTAPLSKDCLLKYSQDVNINYDQFKQCLDTTKYDSVVAAEMSYGETAQVSGTPTFIIGENQGDKMKGFSLGAGFTIEQIKSYVEQVKNQGVDAAAAVRKQSELAGLSAYETQLRDYYSQQGQTGATLQASIDSGLSSRKQDIESQSAVKEYAYGDGALKGDKSNKVVLMEFSDYECPYCRRYAAGVGLEVNSQLIETNQLLYVFRDFPLVSIHPSARRAANAARCAGEQNKYFEYHDALFDILNK